MSTDIQIANDANKPLKSETIPLFDVRRDKSAILKKYSISWIYVCIISFACTISQLIYKSWYVFAAFIDTEYRIQFYELSWSLALMALSAFPTMFVIPWLNTFKCHYLCLIVLSACMTLTILNSILSGSTFNIFVVCFARVFLGQMFWTIGNSIVFHFMQETHPTDKWKKNTATTIFMGSWTFSTVLFLASGSLIDAYGFRVTMMMAAALNIAVSILLFYQTPAISLNDFIEIERTVQASSVVNQDDTSITDTESSLSTSTGCNNTVLSDLHILCSDMFVCAIMMNTLACVTNWGMYYGSFGLWLTQLFDLDAERLGLYVTICEAVAETIALCSIPILSRYVSNSQLCIIGGICETSSVVILNVMLWNGGYILNEYVLTLANEWAQIGIVLGVIFLFYLGHEFLYISLLVNIDIVPKKQHGTAVALYGCADFFGAFIGQTFVTYVFNTRGMVAMAPYMLIVESASIMCLIAMNIFRNRNAKKQYIQHP